MSSHGAEAGESSALQDGRWAFRPLTPSLWQDFELLFGARGAYGGCWCMWWRLSRAEFEKGQAGGNRKAMRALVRSGRRPGLLAFRNGEPVGWCAVAPREEFAVLERSRVLKRLDDRPVWSIVCLYVHPRFRGQGVAGRLVRAAVEYAAKRGARTVEAYPTRPRGGRLPPVSSFMGVPSLFAREGFRECARPSESRLIVRLDIGSGRRRRGNGIEREG